MAEAALVPLLVGLPLLAAGLARIPSVAGSRAADVLAVVGAVAVAVVGVVVAVAARGGTLVHHVGGWGPQDGRAVGIPLVADVASAGLVATCGVLVAAASLWIAASPERRREVPSLTLLLLGAAAGFALAGDLFTVFVFAELLSIGVVAVSGGKIEDPAAALSSINLAAVSTVGAVLLLTGVGLLYRLGGTPNLAEAGEQLAGRPGAAVVVAAALALAGLAIKAGLTPFHLAHVDLHTATWSAHAGLFGALVLPLGLYGTVRLRATALAGLEDLVPLLRGGLLVAALVTALVGAVMALVQDQLKRLLAFSSVAHLGIAAAGAALLDPDGLAGAAAYVVGHGLVKVALLLAAGALLHRLGSLHLRDLTGRGRDARAAVALLAVGAPLLAGSPPSGLHVGKTTITEALEAAGYAGLVPLVYLAAGLTGAALARHVVHLWAGWSLPDDAVGIVTEWHPQDLHRRTPRLLLAVPAVLLAAGATVMLLPGALEVAAEAGVSLADDEAHRAAVLERAVGTPPPPPELAPWTRSSLRSGTLVAVGGVVGGVLVAARWRRTRRVVTAPLRWLRLAHSGVVGDQVVWLIGGVTLWTAWLVAAGG